MCTPGVHWLREQCVAEHVDFYLGDHVEDEVVHTASWRCPSLLRDIFRKEAGLFALMEAAHGGSQLNYIV